MAQRDWPDLAFLASAALGMNVRFCR